MYVIFLFWPPEPFFRSVVPRVSWRSIYLYMLFFETSNWKSCLTVKFFSLSLCLCQSSPISFPSCWGETFSAGRSLGAIYCWVSIKSRYGSTSSMFNLTRNMFYSHRKRDQKICCCHALYLEMLFRPNMNGWLISQKVELSFFIMRDKKPQKLVIVRLKQELVWANIFNVTQVKLKQLSLRVTLSGCTFVL